MDGIQLQKLEETHICIATNMSAVIDETTETVFSGTYCELDIDACISSPCQHGSSCMDLEGANGYSCYCQSGYLGVNCEQRDECHEYNCYHGYPVNDGGICRCNCQGGFAGMCGVWVKYCLLKFYVCCSFFISPF